MRTERRNRGGRNPPPRVRQPSASAARDSGNKNPVFSTAKPVPGAGKAVPADGGAPGLLSGLPVGLQLGGLDKMTLDAFSNPLARIGADSVNMLEATQYVRSNITANFMKLNNLYRENWVVKRLVDVVPEDMTKNWYKVVSQLSPDAKKQLSRLERRTKVRSKILEGMKWGRLYGGAAAVIIIDGHDEILEEPLDLDAIMPGSFKGLVILDRWCGISPGMGVVRDISDPDFGMPEYYNITASAIGAGIRIHHSRIIRFIGRPLPYIEQVMEMYWGSSEIEHILSELEKYDNTSYNIAALVFAANLKVYKMEGFDQFATMPTEVQRDLYNTLTMMNWMMCNQGMQIIGATDEFTTHQYTFSGLSDIYEMFMLDVSGASGIPVTKLYGRSPAGLNATGESDMQNYNDSIEEKNESELRPVIDKLLPIMCMSEFGAVPDDLDFAFNPCRRPTEEEKKNIVQHTSGAVVETFNAGIISHKTALTELRESSDATGMWNSISDEDIEKADSEYQQPGELPMPPMPYMSNANFSEPSAENTPTADGDWNEANVNRGPDGKFGSGGGAIGGDGSEAENLEPAGELEAGGSSTEAFNNLMGTEYAGVKGDAAVDKLLTEKQGHVKEAFYREDVGGVDLFWGDETAGLCHIMKERESRGSSGRKFAESLSDVVEKGVAFSGKDSNRLNIAYKGSVAVIAFELRGTETTALLTAFRTKK